jgi:D-lactate dehydrogenase (cytochrome)
MTLLDCSLLFLLIVRESLRVNGTITGEHGIGLGKKNLLIEEFGTSGIKAMKTIKQALDPLNILNPGKVIDMAAAV